jgi:dTDP-glucose 4,6-dehydratase
MTIIVTGGAGFIGSNFVLDWFDQSVEPIVNVDKLTYAGNLNNLNKLQGNPGHVFVRGDVNDIGLMSDLFNQYQPRALIHFAAESHVDRSIHDPGNFVDTNIVGTFRLLEATRQYWNSIDPQSKDRFRFLQISTDEVYGSLNVGEAAFTENNRYMPNSPYAASKAAADHLVRSYHHTYGLPVITTNCSNNYGPYHFPEKLIPLMIHHALSGKSLPIYGDGQQIRDWLYVKDHCSAVRSVLEAGRPGEIYNIGGWNEKTNLEVVQIICDLLNELTPRTDGVSYSQQITFVADRPGHDRRYAIDASKLKNELGWHPAETFETGLRKTVQWYLDNSSWVKSVINGEYLKWLDKNYQKNDRKF